MNTAPEDRIACLPPARIDYRLLHDQQQALLRTIRDLLDRGDEGDADLLTGLVNMIDAIIDAGDPGRGAAGGHGPGGA